MTASSAKTAITYLRDKHFVIYGLVFVTLTLLAEALTIATSWYWLTLPFR